MMGFIKKIKDLLYRVLGIDQSKLFLDPDSAAIVISPDEIDLFMSEDQLESGDGVSMTVSYIIYAIDRQDWISEYVAFLDQEVVIEKQITSEEEDKTKYSHLTLVE